MLRTMDIGIIPYRRNIATDISLPVKMLECIRVGVPVIVPRLRGIQHYFSDEMVTYFEPENMDSLVHSVVEVFENKCQRKQKAERASGFLKEYGWEKHKSVLFELYQSLMPKNPNTIFHN